MGLLGLGYPVTRDANIPHLRAAFYALAFMYIVVITLINIYAVGYEPKPLNSFDFNNTAGRQLWYERFIPHWRGVRNSFPETWTCQPSIIDVNQGG
jgi:hypothetical protein